MLLCASRWFMMPHCSRWAIDELKAADPPVSPPKRLILTTTLPIFDPDWLNPAIESLIRHGPEKISGGDMESLGGKVVGIIGAAHSRILRERARIAQSIPQVQPGIDCNTGRHERLCGPYWTELWWNIIGRRLIDPDDPIPLRDIVDLADCTPSPSTDLRLSCKSAYVQAWRSSPALDIENQIIASATGTIIQYLHSLHMCPEEFSPDQVLSDN
jgi:hypothetical protein